MALCLIHFLVGDSVLSPATSPSWAMVWDLLHFPLAALLVPPRYTFPNSSLDSCLAWTSNMMQASLALLPLKNLHLRCSHKWLQLEAGWVQTMVPMQDMPLGEAGPSPAVSISLLQSSSGGILHWTQVMLWDIDLNHQSGSCLHHHVKGLRVANLGQG